MLLFDESHMYCSLSAFISDENDSSSFWCGVDIFRQCYVDNGFTRDTCILPPEVTDDDQQLFSLAVQVR